MASAPASSSPVVSAPHDGIGPAPADACVRHRRRLRPRPRRGAGARRRPRRRATSTRCPRRRSSGPAPAGIADRASTRRPRTQTDLELALDAATRARRRPRRGRQRRRRPARPPARRRARARAVPAAHGVDRRGLDRPGLGGRAPRAGASAPSTGGPGELLTLLAVGGPADGRAHRGPALPAPRRDAAARLGPRGQQRARSAPTPASRWRSAQPARRPARGAGGGGMRRRALIVLAALLVAGRLRLATTAGAAATADRRQPVTLRLVAYDSFLLSADDARALHGRHRHQGRDRPRRRRRRGRQPGHPHQGQARGRRAVGRRQHAAVPSRRRGHLRALRVARAGPASTRRSGARARPRGHAGRLRRRVRQLRQGLVRGQGHRPADDARRPDRPAPTRTCSSSRTRPRRRPGWPSCWPPSPASAPTGGRSYWRGPAGQRRARS